MRRSAADRKGTRPASSGQGGLGRLLFYFGLSLTGVFVWLLSASRRERFERRWEEMTNLEPLEPTEEELRRERPAPHVPAVAREVEGPAGRLFVDDGGMVGGATPVLFIHGLGGSSGQWRSQLAHLRPTRRAVALDLRGHGDSSPPADGAYGLGDHAADVAAVADALGLERFVLAGHSLGAAVAIIFAGRHPERVAALLLVDPNGDQTRIPRQEIDPFLTALEKDSRGEMEWYFKQILVGSRPGVADQVLADLRLTEAAALRASLESAFATSPLPALAAYEGPKLAILSDLNTLPYSLHNLVEDLPHTFVTGTGHWVMMDEPEEVNERLDELLDEIE